MSCTRCEAGAIGTYIDGLGSVVEIDNVGGCRAVEPRVDTHEGDWTGPRD